MDTMAILNACGNGVKTSENCSMSAYLMLNDGATEARDEAKGMPALTSPSTTCTP
jgi:hypothetical protein